MKKLLPVLLALCVLLTLPVHAAGGKLTAAADSSGDQVKITVRLDNPGLVATRVFVRYDSKALQLTSAENGDVFPKSNAVFGKDITDNPYTMLWDESLRRDNNTNSGTLCVLTFNVKGGTESGKTNVRLAVDKSSTFDVDLNEVTVADGSCSVDVPVVTTRAAETTTAAHPTTSTTAKASPGTSVAANKITQPSVTLSKPNSTTPSPNATVPTTKPGATLPKPNPTTTQKPIAASEQTTAKTPLVPSTTAPTVPSGSTAAAASSAAASIAAQATTAGVTFAEPEKPSAPPEWMEAASAAADETTPEILTAEGVLPTVSETQVEPLIDPEPPTNHRNLLWLLLLIPAAVAVILVVRKKKA